MPTRSDIKNWVLYEEDDNLPIHLQANTKEDLIKKIVEMLEGEGFNDIRMVPKAEYLSNFDDSDLSEDDLEIYDE